MIHLGEDYVISPIKSRPPESSKPLAPNISTSLNEYKWKSNLHTVSQVIKELHEEILPIISKNVVYELEGLDTIGAFNAAKEVRIIFWLE